MREMSYHWECGLAQWACKELTDQFKGRILSEKDVAAMRRVLEMAKKENLEVKVYDTSRTSDRLRALKRRILKTPTAIIEGRRYEGPDKILRAISAMPNR
jgi:hypothetical protein